MVTQNAQMTHKIAVVDEVRTRIGEASASIVSEYRGLSVAELAELRITPWPPWVATTGSSRTRWSAGRSTAASTSRCRSTSAVRAR